MQTEHEAEEIMEESTIRFEKDEQDSLNSRVQTTEESSTVFDEEDTTLIITAESSSSTIIADEQAHATTLLPTKFERSNIKICSIFFIMKNVLIF